MRIELVPRRTLVFEQPADGGPGIDYRLPSYIVSTVTTGATAPVETVVFDSDPKDRPLVHPRHVEQRNCLHRWVWNAPPSHFAIALFHDLVVDAIERRALAELKLPEGLVTAPPVLSVDPILSAYLETLIGPPKNPEVMK